MYYLILLLISHQSHAAITITSVSELMNLDQQHSIVNVNDAHISVDYLRRLIGQKKIHDNNIHQLEISLLESSETTSLLRDDQKWKNVFAGVGHKGMAIPYFNGYACVTGIMPGPKGKCIRDKAIGKAALGCSGKPNQESMDLSDPIYRSDHCFCAECGGMNALQAMIGSGLHKKIVWTAYCHTRGLNSCHCGLVDMSIKDEKTCYDLW